MARKPTYTVLRDVSCCPGKQHLDNTEHFSNTAIQDFDETRDGVPCAPPCTRSPSPAPSATSDYFPGTIHLSKDTSPLDGLEALRAAYTRFFAEMMAQESA